MKQIFLFVQKLILFVRLCFCSRPSGSSWSKPSSSWSNPTPSWSNPTPTAPYNPSYPSPYNPVPSPSGGYVPTYGWNRPNYRPSHSSRNNYPNGMVCGEPNAFCECQYGEFMCQKCTKLCIVLKTRVTW